MGADMMVAAIWMNQRKKPDFENGKKHIEKLKELPVLKWPARIVTELGNCFGTPLEPAPLIETLLGNLESLELAWEGNHREATFIDVAKKRILVTGGLSWGDAPTDLFREIDHLVAAGVTKACGFDF